MCDLRGAGRLPAPQGPHVRVGAAPPAAAAGGAELELLAGPQCVARAPSPDVRCRAVRACSTYICCA